MTNIKTLGFVSESSYSKLLHWCKEQIPTTRSAFSSYAPGRREIWFRCEASLRQETKFMAAKRDNYFESIGNRLFPGWHTGALFYYPAGTCIKPHRDHSVFGATAISVNLGGGVFEIGDKLYRLHPGQIIQFNTKIIHGTKPVKTDRFCLTFWQFKPQYEGLAKEFMF